MSQSATAESILLPSDLENLSDLEKNILGNHLFALERLQYAANILSSVPVPVSEARKVEATIKFLQVLAATSQGSIQKLVDKSRSMKGSSNGSKENRKTRRKSTTRTRSKKA